MIQSPLEAVGHVAGLVEQTDLRLFELTPIKGTEAAEKI
jgi:hypothetical protein